MAVKDHKVAFIIPYFGRWPIWFPAFLISCKTNSSVTWMFFTDCDTTIDKPDNVVFYKSNLNEIQNLISAKVGFEVSLESAYKVCDFRPAFGHVFEDYLKTYDFWGFCDVDIIWGDIFKYITEEIMSEYDIITSLKHKISGHFTIIKNTDPCKFFYKHEDQYKKIFIANKYMRFDEFGFTDIVKLLNDKEVLKVLWDNVLLDSGIESEAYQEYLLDTWEYIDGKVFKLQKGIYFKEHMYLHFINWKPTMKRCEVIYLEFPSQFYISYYKIHYQLHSAFVKKLNDLKNYFYGFHIKFYIYQKKRRLNSLIKRIKRKL